MGTSSAQLYKADVFVLNGIFWPFMEIAYKHNQRPVLANAVGYIMPIVLSPAILLGLSRTSLKHHDAAIYTNRYISTLLFSEFDLFGVSGDWNILAD